MADSISKNIDEVDGVVAVNPTTEFRKPGSGGARQGAGRPKGARIPKVLNTVVLNKKLSGKKKPGRPSNAKLKDEIREELLLRNQIAQEIRDRLPFGLRKKGVAGYPDITEEEIEKEFKKRVAYSAHKLLNAQMSLALGTQTLYKVHNTIDDHGKVKRLHMQVTDPDEVMAFLDDPNMINGEDYYYITTKTPDNNAINSMLDRLMGKTATKIVGANNSDGSEGPIKVIVANFNPQLPAPDPVQPIIETIIQDEIEKQDGDTNPS